MNNISDLNIYLIFFNKANSLQLISRNDKVNSHLDLDLSTSWPQLTTLASCRGRDIRSTGSCSTWEMTAWPEMRWPNTTCTLKYDAAWSDTKHWRLSFSYSTSMWIRKLILQYGRLPFVQHRLIGWRPSPATSHQVQFLLILYFNLNHCLRFSP